MNITWKNKKKVVMQAGGLCSTRRSEIVTTKRRVVMDASGNVKQVNNYYPSGTLMAERRTDQGVQPYKFGGKELDRTNNMDLYDFEARAYDPVLMRFTRPDPLAGKYYSTSPYAYCANNPVNRVDPTGMDWIEDKKGNVFWYKQINQDNVPKGYKYIGTEYNGISIISYDAYENTFGTKSLKVEIGYTDPQKSKENSYNWVQTVEKDDSGGPFVDYDRETKPGKENYPYYQDKYENAASRNKDGYDIKYYDKPSENDPTGSFKAELSLIGDPLGIQKGNKIYAPDTGVQGKNLYVPKFTLRYEFSVKNGMVSVGPIRVVNPSPFQKQTINQIK